MTEEENSRDFVISRLVTTNRDNHGHLLGLLLNQSVWAGINYVLSNRAYDVAAIAR